MTFLHRYYPSPHGVTTHRTILYQNVLVTEREKIHMKIAILEDQPDILELLTTALELAGHRAYPYRTGTSLVETLFTPQSKHAPLPYNLLIIDLYLPGTPSGVEVINSIHQHIQPGTLPIILTLATSQSELSDLQAQLPTVTVLRQPFHLKDLLALIERRALSPTPCSV